MIEENRKLTSLLRGKVVASSAFGPEGLVVAFSDGSRMIVAPPGAGSALPPPGTEVASVFQSADSIEIRHLDGGVSAVGYVLGGSSAQVRDPRGKIVYVE